MIAKLAILFLIVMGVMALFFGRGKRTPRVRRRTKPDTVTQAARCPDCNAWIVAGARCPCSTGK